MEEEVTALVLQNKGAPARFVVLDEAGTPRISESGQPMLEQRWIRYTANEIADFEDRFGGVEREMPMVDVNGEPVMERGKPKRELRLLDPAEVFNEGLIHAGRKTIRFMLALGLHLTEEQTGPMMAPDLWDEYVTAVGCSYQIAMGIDPFVVKKMWDAGLTVTGKIIELRPEVLKAMVGVIDDAVRLVSPGPSGTRSGRRSTATRKSSGGSRRGS